MKAKEFRNGRLYLIIGVNWKRFGLGISIDRWSFNLDLIWLWISIEY